MKNNIRVSGILKSLDILFRNLSRAVYIHENSPEQMSGFACIVYGHVILIYKGILDTKWYSL